jgi:hypothetical protein
LVLTRLTFCGHLDLIDTPIVIQLSRHGQDPPFDQYDSGPPTLLPDFQRLTIRGHHLSNMVNEGVEGHSLEMTWLDHCHPVLGDVDSVAPGWYPVSHERSDPLSRNSDAVLEQLTSSRESGIFRLLLRNVDGHYGTTLTGRTPIRF